MRTGFSLCAVVCLLLTGCGTSKSAFPFQPGQSWVMANVRDEWAFFDAACPFIRWL